MIKKLDMYLLGKFLKTFLFVMLMLVVVVSVIDYTEKNDKYIRAGLDAVNIVKYYLAFMPWVANLTMPIITFISAILVTSGLAAKSEIIAIQASGVSFKRMLLPFLIGGILIAVFSYLLSGYIIPIGNKFRVGFEITYLKKRVPFSEKDVHMKIRSQDYFYFKRYNPNLETAYTVTIEKIQNDQIVEKLHAKSMKWDTTVHKWQLRDWWSREIDGLSEKVKRGEIMDTVLNITPKDFDTNMLLHETFTNTELKTHIDVLALRGADDIRTFLKEYYLRHMQPFAIIIVTFMAVIVAARKSRQGTGFQIALGFLLAFIFIIFFMFATAIAEKGNMNVLLAIWLPNIVFSFVTLMMYYLVPR